MDSKRNHWGHVESDTFRSPLPQEKERANGGFKENSLSNPIFWNAGITYSKRYCWDLVEIASHPIFWFVHFFPFFDISLKFLRDLRTNRTFFPTNLSGFFSRQPPFLKRLRPNSLDFDVTHFLPTGGSGLFFDRSKNAVRNALTL